MRKGEEITTVNSCVRASNAVFVLAERAKITFDHNMHKKQSVVSERASPLVVTISIAVLLFFDKLVL